MARPTKLTKEWLEAAEKVINDDINAIILTDEELVSEINELLEEKQRISDRTFRSWKEKGEKAGKSFFLLIKKALYKQKKHLFEEFRREPNQWQRWAWIIERKFDDWNIKYKTDITSGGKEILTLDQINEIIARRAKENSSGRKI